MPFLHEMMLSNASIATFIVEKYKLRWDCNDESHLIILLKVPHVRLNGVNIFYICIFRLLLMHSSLFH